ncbi:DUF4336 domain-containing protein [Haladaptatus sp. DFWS20]|uniref:DUF4336 domain-containing protein n=1 Tax=Haladaptatus sp. DFWS20 TaxID=3403467 RepID=UPI003EBA6E92
MLSRLDSNLWIHEEPLRFFGLEIGRIMTVVRLSSGGLFVQSPARLTPELKETLDDLGGVRFVVPASKLHGHLHMEQYREAYPDAELLAAPGLASRRTDLTFDALLGSVPDPRWSADIDQIAIMGHRWLTEIAFFHRPSRTLIVGDVGYHVTPEEPLSLRLLGRVAGVYDRVGPPIDFRLTVANEATLRRSIRNVLGWNFDRVIPGHGSVLESGGREAVLDGFDWLL